MNQKLKIGDFGQKIAADFLSRRGYEILEEKFFTKGGEVDLVAMHGEQLVFVEVKTRLSNRCGLPEDAVDWRKIEKLNQAALKYLQKNRVNHENYRLDCVAVEIDKINKKARIRHYKGIG